MTMQIVQPLALGLLLLTATEARAAPARAAGAIEVRQPWARETAPGQSMGGGFMILVNPGKQGDTLIAATTPIAAQVQLHTTVTTGSVSGMRQIKGGVAIPAGGQVTFQPGQAHLMFIGLKRPLRRGDRVPVTLKFQRQGQVTVNFLVQAAHSSAAEGGAHEGH